MARSLAHAPWPSAQALDGATDTPIGTDRGTLKLRYARPQGSSNDSATNGDLEVVQVSAQECEW